jgi:uncharacterized protein (TIGR00730 family)
MNQVVYRSICVYCGSADHLHSEYIQAATEMGALLAHSGIRLVYGAGKTGLMGAVADGALQAGGEVIGVVPENLFTPQLIHSNLTHLEVVPDIQSRKARMSNLAEAFIALPGGFGTFDELFETLTWAQIGIHRKPVGLLNTRNYFDPLLGMVQKARDEGFIYSEHSMLLIHDLLPDSLLTRLCAFKHPENLDRWVNREDTNININEK